MFGRHYPGPHSCVHAPLHRSNASECREPRVIFSRSNRCVAGNQNGSPPGLLPQRKRSNEQTGRS